MYRFERAPILEPDDLDISIKSAFAFLHLPYETDLEGSSRDEVRTHVLSGHTPPKGLPHEVANLFPCLRCQIICSWVVFEIEFCPDDEVNDLRINAVGPVIVEDLDVAFVVSLAFSNEI